MVTLLIGKKGTGKTKKLIARANEAVAASAGNVVVIEKGAKLTYDVTRLHIQDLQGRHRGLGGVHQEAAKPFRNLLYQHCAADFGRRGGRSGFHQRGLREGLNHFGMKRSGGWLSLAEPAPFCTKKLYQASDKAR